jgi:ribonuclease P protein component
VSRPFAFPKKNRLRGAADFRRVREAKRSAKNDVLRLSWRKNGLDVTRMGAVVPIRGLGAVGRNRVKRIFREVFRLSLGSTPTGYDLVLSPIDASKASDFAACGAAYAALLLELKRRERLP